jgi:hypothetical protein
MIMPSAARLGKPKSGRQWHGPARLGMMEEWRPDRGNREISALPAIVFLNSQ